jgi:hypothetical protein
MEEVGALVEEDKVLMLCRQQRGSGVVKGSCEHEEAAVGWGERAMEVLASGLLRGQRLAGPKA